MAYIVTSYRYTIEMNLILNGNEYEIEPDLAITNYDYDKYNMPVIYLGLRLSSDIYNKMVNNADKAIISFRVFKHSNSATSAVNSVYFEDRFVYFMSSNPNYQSTLKNMTSYTSVGSDSEADTYLEGYIGMLSLKCINDNKVLINDIIKNSNPISIIHKYTSHMNMCIEPFDNNDVIDQFIIPPTTSITNFLKYFNNYHCLYKYGYRFFRDFGRTYLLSTMGNLVEEKENKYGTVIFSIRDPVDALNKINSIELDNANHAYIIYVNAEDTSLTVNRSNDKKYNSILGVDTGGEIAEDVLNLPDSPDSTEKYIIERTASGNLDKIYNTKQNIESSTIMLSISKTEIDGSIFTPNKEYYVKNYESSREFDGKYVLSFKKEIFIQQDANYINSITIGLRKV